MLHLKQENRTLHIHIYVHTYIRNIYLESGENIGQGAFLDIGSGGRNTNQESQMCIHIPAQAGKFFLCVDVNVQL